MKLLSVLVVWGVLCGASLTALAAGEKGTLGAACASDSACAAGLFCLTGTLADGIAVAGGLCTARCDADPQVCVAPAACVHLGTGTSLEGDYCVESCHTPDAGTPPPEKCHGRPDFACQPAFTTLACHPLRAPDDCAALTLDGPATSGPGGTGCVIFGGLPLPMMGPSPDMAGVCEDDALCLPSCVSDDACPKGLQCNGNPTDAATDQFGGIHFCDASPHGTDPPGARCNAGSSSCAGRCQQGQGICGQDCIVGQACGPAAATTARCLPLVAPRTDVGALGSCAVLCSCDSECQSELGPNFHCNASTTAGVTTLGFRGVCSEATPSGFAPGVPSTSLGEKWCQPPPSCSVASKACHGSDGCLGVSECQSDGSFGACVCAEPGSSAGGEAATGGAPAEATLPGNAKSSSCSIVGVAKGPAPRGLSWLFFALALGGSRRFRLARRAHRAGRAALPGADHG